MAWASYLARIWFLMSRPSFRILAKLIHTDVRKLTQAVLLVVLCLIFYANKEPQSSGAHITKELKNSKSVGSTPVKPIKIDAG